MTDTGNAPPRGEEYVLAKISFGKNIIGRICAIIPAVYRKPMKYIIYVSDENNVGIRLIYAVFI